MKKIHQGFTLVEIMVVISIFAFISSIVFAVTSYARAKAIDTAQAQTIKQISNAVQARIIDKGAAPENPFGNDIVVYSNMTGDGRIAGDGLNGFGEVMNQLVTEGYLDNVPNIPNPNSAIGYYNYGPTSAQGAVVFGALATAPKTTTGPNGSCRFSNPAPGHTGMKLQQKTGDAPFLTFIKKITNTVFATSTGISVYLGTPTLANEEGATKNTIPDPRCTGGPAQEPPRGYSYSPVYPKCVVASPQDIFSPAGENQQQSEQMEQLNNDDSSGDSGNTPPPPPIDPTLLTQNPTCDSTRPSGDFCICSK
jgi:prepilin-type N-terminal cleavage/methylation domain-containing protein